MKANATPRTNVKFDADVSAVSPIVATLLLVLVAAGAAIGFGVFLNGFQHKTQDSTSSEASKDVIRVAGSTTVTPMVQAGLENFAAANPTYKIDLAAVGSGSGIRAVCHGNADIGMSSKTFGVEDGVSSGQIIPGADQKTCPDVNNDGVQDAGKTLRLVPIAIDGIALLTKDTSHCGTGLLLTKDVVTEVYLQNLDAQRAAPAPSRVGAGIAGKLAAEAAGVAYKWTDLLVACAGSPAIGGNAIVVLQRADAGGTEDAFCTLMMSSGCSGGELSIAGTKDTDAFDGNTNLENGILANADRLGFMSYGFAKSSTGKIAAFGNTAAPLVPTDSKVKDGARGVVGGYEASRKLWFLTAGEPNSSEQVVIDFFVNNAANNKLFANKAGYIGINE